jgi:hypothetical protein
VAQTVMLKVQTDDPALWTGRDFPVQRRWTRTLTAPMIAEIETALRDALGRNLAFWKVDPVTYPLPQTAPLIAEAYDDIENGCGFAVLAGWPVERFSFEENRMAYALIGSHLGVNVVQNGAGDRLVEVTNKDKPYNEKSRGYHSDAYLPFHTDATKGEAIPVHIVGLMCLEMAQSGGLSAIASAAALHRAVATERPDLLPVLERGFRHHRRGQHLPGESPLSIEPIPVFSRFNGELHCRYNRNPINWAQKEGEIHTAQDTEALDFVDAVLARPDFPLAMELQKGDMQFIANYAILHSRTQYTDAPGRKRHLLRLWLNDPSSKRTTGDLLDRFSGPESRFYARD